MHDTEPGEVCAGAEDEAAQLLSNEHALARTNAGMASEQSTPVAQQSLSVAAVPSNTMHHQVTPNSLPTALHTMCSTWFVCISVKDTHVHNNTTQQLQNSSRCKLYPFHFS